MVVVVAAMVVVVVVADYDALCEPDDTTHGPLGERSMIEDD